MTEASTHGPHVEPSGICEAPSSMQRFRFIQPAARSPVKIVGDSFLIDNIVAYSKTCLSSEGTTYFSFKMHSFMSGAWVEYTSRDEPTLAVWLSLLSSEKIDALQSRRARILFDMSNEGLPFEHCISGVEAAHRDLAARGILASDCVFLTQNRAFAAAYERWACRERILDRFRFLCYDYYPRRFVGEFTRSNPEFGSALIVFRANLDRPRDKMFLSLNFTPRPHRIAIVSWMLGMHYDQHSLISFKGFSMNKLDATDYLPAPFFPEEYYIDIGFKRLKSIGAMDLDLGETDAAFIPEFGLAAPKLFERTYFSVVTESEVMSGSQQRITEKMFKPIAGFHPFVVFGNSNSLARLRELGFKTFHPFINEDYDFCDDARVRTHLAMGEINKLMRLNFTEIQTWYLGMADRLEHNHRHLYSLDKTYGEIIEQDVLCKLAE